MACKINAGWSRSYWGNAHRDRTHAHHLGQSRKYPGWDCGIST
ncbi:hypothetical protein [Metallosphaera hakonensis]|nr:hypothetical protein [Metallosphaera hakonensis]